MVDLEGAAANPIPAEAADAIGGVKNGVYDFTRDCCPVDPLLDESYVGLTVIRLERLIRQGAQRADGMPMCFNSCDQIRIESKTEERGVSSSIHAAAEAIVRTKNAVLRSRVRSISNYPTCGRHKDLERDLEFSNRH
jgi:hypothetical protein